MRSLLKGLTTAIVAGSLWLGSGLMAPSQALTVDEIISKGTLVVGIPGDNPPYGSLGTSMEPEGLDIDLANRLGEYLGVTVELVQVTSPNRIPYLMTGQVDVIISTLGMTPERAAQIWFSTPYAGANIVLVAPAELDITTAADTAGLRVGVPRGSIEDLAFTRIAPPDANITRFDDNATAVQALIAGQIDVLGVGWLAADRLNAEHPGRNFENKLPLRTTYFGVGVRKGDADLLQWLNTTLLVMRTTGELEDMHMKWVGLPLGVLPSL